VSYPGYLDTLGIWDATAGFPEQFDASRSATEDALGQVELPQLDVISSVVIFGMGASGIAASAVAAGGEPVAARPILVGRSFEVPSFVGPDTLVVAVSHSGNTAETCAAAEGALERGAYVLTVSGGGALQNLSDSGALHLSSAPGLPASRVALPSLVVPLVMALAQIGVLPEIDPSLDAAHDALARRRDALIAPGNEAETVARTIGRTIPLIYGSSGVAAVAAARWKEQVNEYAKTPAFFSALPELSHNEVAGWGQHGDVTRQVLSLVTLRHSGEHPEVTRQFAAVLEVTDEVMANVIPVWAQGTDDPSRFFDLALFGDFVALHMAGRESIDPGPVATDEVMAGPA
jgi:glucose/mannose-6-phosphate isomerase